MQFQGKLMNQTWEKGKTITFEPIFGLQIFCHGFYLYCILDIVASYHWMQYQGKLMNQIWKNGKKPSFGTNFGPFSLNLGPKYFFHKFYLYYMLDIVAIYRCMQFQGKLMNQTWENSKKTSFGTDFDLFGPNLG